MATSLKLTCLTVVVLSIATAVGTGTSGGVTAFISRSFDSIFCVPTTSPKSNSVQFILSPLKQRRCFAPARTMELMKVPGSNGSNGYAVVNIYQILVLLINAVAVICILYVYLRLGPPRYQVYGSGSAAQNGRVELRINGCANGELGVNVEEDTDDEEPENNIPPPAPIAPRSPPTYDDDDDDEEGLTILIVGDANTGKSTFISRNLDATGVITYPGSFLHRNGFQIHDFEFWTDIGIVLALCYDRHGGYANCFDEILNQPCIMIMIDVTNMETLESLTFWINKIYEVARGNAVEIVIVGNKIDSDERVIERDMVTQRTLLPYFEVSALQNQNYEEPFLHLLQQHFLSPDLRLVRPIRLAEPQVQIVPAAPVPAPPSPPPPAL